MEIKNSLRLSFSLVTPDDVEWLYQLDQDVEVMRYINGGIKTSMSKMNNVLLPRLLSYTNPRKGWGLWKVSLLNSSEVDPDVAIGWILVRPMSFFCQFPEYDNIELGWRFKKTAWGFGYAFEAAQAIYEALSQDPEVVYFSAIADEDNHASVKLMQKLGMNFIKKDWYCDPLGDVEVVYYQRKNEELLEE